MWFFDREEKGVAWHLLHDVFNEPVLSVELPEDGLGDLSLLWGRSPPKLIKTDIKPFIHLAVDGMKPSTKMEQGQERGLGSIS